MPHLIVEHSAALADTHDLGALSDALFDAACAFPAFADHAHAVKTRMIASNHVRSGISPQTTAHLMVRMLPGRDPATKAALSQTLLEVLKSHLADVGSLSVEIVDMDGTSYAKRAL